MMKWMIKFARQTCCVYTVSAMLFLLLNLAIEGSLAQTYINARSFLLVFVFAMFFALANAVYALPGLAHGLRLLAHFVLVVGSLYLCLYLPSGAGTATSGKLLILMLLLVMYWLFMGLYLAMSRTIRARQPKKTEYQSVFKK